MVLRDWGKVNTVSFYIKNKLTILYQKQNIYKYLRLLEKKVVLEKLNALPNVPWLLDFSVIAAISHWNQIHSEN